MRTIPAAIRRPLNNRFAILVLIVGAVVITIALLLSRTILGLASAQPLSAQLDQVRTAIAPLASPDAARGAGYAPFLSCISEGAQGAMGIHFVSSSLVEGGTVDPLHPQALLYDADPAGDQLHLAGVEYVVMASPWNANHSQPPSVLGQQLHYVESPNRFGLPAFYSLHVWLWEPNPKGMFEDWNPRIACPRLGGE